MTGASAKKKEPIPIRKEKEQPKSKLPEVDALKDRATESRAKELLKEADQLYAKVELAECRLDEIKEDLIEICAAFELGGIRHGRMGLYYGGKKTKRTLSKELLVEYGVAPEIIGASYEESKPFIDSRWVPQK